PNPIIDSQGVQATDLPASYYFDPVTETEWSFYLDWESLTWANHQNIFGFLGGQCSLHTKLLDDPETPLRQRYFGFRGLDNEYVGKIFPKGKQSFVYYYRFAPAQKPTEWEANEKLITGIAPFVKQTPTQPPHKMSWQETAIKGMKELQDKPAVAQVDLGGAGLGLRAYGQIGDFSSPNPASRVELMTQADVVWPLLFWQKLNQPGLDASFFERLETLLPRFFDSKHKFIGNWFPHEETLLPQDQETWYFFENGLIKFGWIALLKKDKKLQEQFISFAETCCLMAEEYNYLFPLRYNWHSKETSGSRKNYISGGLFAYGMILAYLTTKDKKYLTQAEKALLTLQRLPLELLNHEPQQTGFAALAAYHLFEETSLPKWREFGWQLVYHQLRMFYWYTDRTVLDALGCDTAGMARSFPSKIYPVVKHNAAFKENVESYLPWLYLILKDRPQPPLLDLINLARLNNFYFFDDYQGITKNKSWTPLESLPALPESGQKHRGGGVGHAIYGFGESVWNALIFETFATSKNPHLFIACLDLLDPLADLSKSIHLIIYNPTEKKINAAIDLHDNFTKERKLVFSRPASTKVTSLREVSVSLLKKEYT
ncbi:hypothetical protein MUP65_01830, partial [Patescibacteria group bacterium]|nr:hypothetical protein [Patescibacteria group bacterium]